MNATFASSYSEQWNVELVPLMTATLVGDLEIVKLWSGVTA